MKRFFLFFLLLFAPLTAQELVEESNYVYWKELVRMSITLLLVIILVMITLSFLRKFLNAKAKALNEGQHIKILERRVLHAKANLYLIEVYGKVCVIGETAQGIHPILELPENVDLTGSTQEHIEKKPWNFFKRKQ